MIWTYTKFYICFTFQDNNFHCRVLSFFFISIFCWYIFIIMMWCLFYTEKYDSWDLLLFLLCWGLLTFAYTIFLLLSPVQTDEDKAEVPLYDPSQELIFPPELKVKFTQAWPVNAHEIFILLCQLVFMWYTAETQKDQLLFMWYTAEIHD